MQSKDAVRAFLLEYVKRYPLLEVDDLLKLLYQSAFGCGHFAPSEERVMAFLEQELAETMADEDREAGEAVLGSYARAYLSPCAQMGLGMKTLGRLFMLTADEAPGEEAGAWFASALDCLEAMAEEGELPFSADAVHERLNAYRAEGCPSLHHSQRYREAYHPAYRILRRDYAQLLPLFARIDRLLERRERVIIAIDGNSGSGKSTLAALLARVYDGAALVHMDDFFLQMHQRTPERFATPGGNVDHERFLSEVLMPLSRGEAFCYRPLDCSVMEIGEGETINPGRLTIVEGSYSLHPQLEGKYDLKIALRIDAKAQAERILKRNGDYLFKRFRDEWIPMENLYFDATHMFDRADVTIDVTPLEEGIARYDVQERTELA